MHCEVLSLVLPTPEGGLHSTATRDHLKGRIVLGWTRSCLDHAGKPSKDSGSGTQEQTYVKTVIELHDKYLQVCLLFSHSLTSCSSCLHNQSWR